MYAAVSPIGICFSNCMLFECPPAGGLDNSVQPWERLQEPGRYVKVEVTHPYILGSLPTEAGAWASLAVLLVSEQQ